MIGWTVSGPGPVSPAESDSGFRSSRRVRRSSGEPGGGAIQSHGDLQAHSAGRLRMPGVREEGDSGAGSRRRGAGRGSGEACQ
eukprot:591878-Hanusia_phi.AAC.1